MRTILICALVLASCTHAAPVAAPAPRVNLVCAMIALNDKASTCEDKTHEGSHVDVAFVSKDGGVKVCWETFDAKAPLACATLTLSKAEAADIAVAQERERIKREAAQGNAVAPSSPAAKEPPPEVKVTPAAKAGKAPTKP